LLLLVRPLSFAWDLTSAPRPSSLTAAQIQSIRNSTRVWAAAEDSCRHS